jgi:hypothetical protein
MELFLQLAVAGVLVFFIWRLYKGMKSQPEAFTKEKMGKSFYTIGILTLGLILAVTVMVMFIR